MGDEIRISAKFGASQCCISETENPDFLKKPSDSIFGSLITLEI